MITKKELKNRVAARRQKLESESEKLDLFKDSISSLIEDIKKRTVIYGMLHSLPLWQRLESLMDDSEILFR